MSCDIENHFDNKTEIRRNLKINVKKIRYKSDNREELKNQTSFTQSDLKLNSTIFKMKEINKKSDKIQHHNETIEINHNKNESINEHFNCHHYHHFHTNNQNEMINNQLSINNQENQSLNNHHHYLLNKQQQQQNDFDEHHSLQSEDSDELDYDQLQQHLTDITQNEHVVDEDDEDEICNEDDEIEEIDELDEDSYQSDDDHSTATSTSTLNNLRNSDDKQDKVNCCNCCYCEVFGHGMPSQAPTSRNFNEMRERLRLRYAQKQEVCKSSSSNFDESAHHSHFEHFNLNNLSATTNKKNSHTQHLINSSNQLKPNELNVKKDDRDLDELLRFINNEDENKKCEKKNKKKKDKKKKKEIVSEQLDNENNLINCDKLNSNKLIDKSNQIEAINKIDKKIKQQVNKKQSNNQKQINRNICDNSNLKSLNEQQIISNNHNKTNTAIENDKHLDKHFNQHLNQHSDKKTDKHKIIKLDDKNVEQEQQNLLSTKQSKKSSIKKSTKLNDKNKKSNKDNLDDVFLPKDIDYEDDFEKELEEFKRFCFNSVPRPNKEKVNLDLKNIVIKKKTNLNNRKTQSII